MGDGKKFGGKERTSGNGKEDHCVWDLPGGSRGFQFSCQRKGTQVWSLFQEDPTCGKETKRECDNYWSPCALETELCNQRNCCDEQPMHQKRGSSPCCSRQRPSTESTEQFSPSRRALFSRAEELCSQSYAQLKGLTSSTIICHMHPKQLPTNHSRRLLRANVILLFYLMEKTLERPLDCKEMKTVHPKGH